MTFISVHGACHFGSGMGAAALRETMARDVDWAFAASSSARLKAGSDSSATPRGFCLLEIASATSWTAAAAPLTIIAVDVAVVADPAAMPEALASGLLLAIPAGAAASVSSKGPWAKF